MPKRGEKNVLASGICTFPAIGQGREQPVRFRFRGHREGQGKAIEIWFSRHTVRRLAIIGVSPMRKFACITLFSEPGGTMPG